MHKSFFVNHERKISRKFKVPSIKTPIEDKFLVTFLKVPEKINHQKIAYISNGNEIFYCVKKKLAVYTFSIYFIVEFIARQFFDQIASSVA